MYQRADQFVSEGVIHCCHNLGLKPSSDNKQQTRLRGNQKLCEAYREEPHPRLISKAARQANTEAALQSCNTAESDGRISALRREGVLLGQKALRRTAEMLAKGGHEGAGAAVAQRMGDRGAALPLAQKFDRVEEP